MSDKQPEALRLAKISEDLAADGALLHCWPWPQIAKLYRDDAAELRRQHALIAELVEALEDGMKTAGFERHPFRPWHAKAHAALSKAKEQP